MNEQTKKPSIVFYIGSLSRGGAERVIVNLAEYFFANEYDVTIVTKMREKTEYSVSKGIHRIIADITQAESSRSRVCNLYRRIRKLRKCFREVHPDYIVSFIGKNNLMAITASRGLNIPVTVSVRSNPKREYSGKLRWKLMCFLFGKTEGIVLQTTQAKQLFPKKLQDKAIVLPNPLNYHFIREEYRGERRKEIVWVGRVDDNKNPLMLLYAFAELATKYSDWHVIYYGEGETLDKLKSECTRLGLDGQVSCKGRIEQVENAIDKAAIYVLTSKVEGMPNALMEAMALGLAVISTDCPCGGPADLIENGKNGILVPVDDVQELQNALDKLMADTEYRQQLSYEAYKIVQKIHPDTVNKQWMDYVEHTKCGR